MTYFTKACQSWHQGNIDTAIQLFKKYANDAKATAEQRDMGIYMVAYLYLIKAKQIRDEMAVLGVDLSAPYHDYYYMASLCYQQIQNQAFNPADCNLPEIAAHDVELMLETSEQFNQIKQQAAQYYPTASGRELMCFMRELIRYTVRLFSSKLTETVKI